MEFELDEQAVAPPEFRCTPQGSMPSAAVPHSLVKALRSDGFARWTLKDWIAMLGSHAFSQWRAFSASWDTLGPDIWMKDGGTYRRRRFATYAIEGTSVSRKPHQAHFQSRHYNRVNGGIDRWFSPVDPVVGEYALISGLVSAGCMVARNLVGEQNDKWHAELHQIRIETTGGDAAFPTPEGLHRDGVTLVLMMLIAKLNMRGGVTSLIDGNTGEAHKFELSRPCEGLIFDDRRMRHMVSPITSISNQASAYRDVLILTFRPDTPSTI